MDCELRKLGQEFCDECPHRAVREDCAREGYAPRSSLTPRPSPIQRAGVFVLSAMALLIMPVVFRTMLRLRVEGDVSHVVAVVVGLVSVVLMIIVGAAALYGIYQAVWSGKRKLFA